MTYCKICSHTSNSIGTATVLGKHSIEYFRCDGCGFVQTEDPFWLPEAYSNALSSRDVGLVSRNLELAAITKTLLTGYFDTSARFLDYGGGAGLFVRLMRDRGYQFYWADKFATNIFAQGFAAEEHQYELVTAFEVAEHLVDPMEEFERMISYSRNLLFSTALLPSHAPNPGEWWYYGLEHGQHVALYTFAALQEIARRLKLNFYSNGASLHLLTERRLSSLGFRILSRPIVSKLFDIIWRRPTLAEADYKKATSRSSNHVAIASRPSALE